jgi:hypothetical protein
MTLPANSSPRARTPHCGTLRRTAASAAVQFCRRLTPLLLAFCCVAALPAPRNVALHKAAPDGAAAAPSLAASLSKPQKVAPAAQTGTAALPKRIRPPVGEHLEYSGTWRLWHAGFATADLKQADGNEEIEFAADTVGIVSVLYPVRDRIESRYDPETYCATEVVKDTVEGRRKRHTAIFYQPDVHQLVLDEQNLNNRPPTSKHEIKPIPGCVLDMFSGIYYVRTLPLRVGEVYNFPVNEGGNTIEVQVVADLKETITTPAGTFNTIRTEPKVFNHKLFKRKGRMWIWFSDDDRRLPVMLKAKVLWGTITATLTRYTEPHP